MELKDMLDAVRSERVQFVTTRPPGSPFAMLDRRVVVVGPPELKQLANLGQPEVLEQLIELLRDPTRAWAAQVLLAALTQREEKQVDTFATSPLQWWGKVGKGAHERWRRWFDDNRARLTWDAANSTFIEQPQT